MGLSLVKAIWADLGVSIFLIINLKFSFLHIFLLSLLLCNQVFLAPDASEDCELCLHLFPRCKPKYHYFPSSLPRWGAIRTNKMSLWFSGKILPQCLGITGDFSSLIFLGCSVTCIVWYAFITFSLAWVYSLLPIFPKLDYSNCNLISEK